MGRPKCWNINGECFTALNEDIRTIFTFYCKTTKELWMIFGNLGDVSQIIFIEFYVLTVRIASIFFSHWFSGIGNGMTDKWFALMGILKGITEGWAFQCLTTLLIICLTLLSSLERNWSWRNYYFKWKRCPVFPAIQRKPGHKQESGQRMSCFRPILPFFLLFFSRQLDIINVFLCHAVRKLVLEIVFRSFIKKPLKTA